MLPTVHGLQATKDREHKAHRRAQREALVRTTPICRRSSSRGDGGEDYALKSRIVFLYHKRKWSPNLICWHLRLGRKWYRDQHYAIKRLVYERGLPVRLNHEHCKKLNIRKIVNLGSK